MKYSAVTVLGVAVGWSGLALAQDVGVGVGGALRQQIEGNRRIELPQRVLPDSASTAAKPSARPGQGPGLQIQRFRFAGNTMLSPQDFEPLLAEYAGQPLDIDLLRNVIGPKVAELYRRQGWVVHVSLQEPLSPQAEEAVYNIVEARLGQVVFEGKPPSLVSQEQILEVFAQQLGTQNRLNNLHVDRALLLASDLPGVAVTARQRAGKTPGSTDVVVTAQDKPAYAGDITLDNTGSRSTGAERVAANVEWRSPTGRADALNAAFMHTQGSDYGRLGYTAPIGRDGLRLGVNMTQLQYDVVAPELKPLGIRGSSSSAGLEFNYPIVRARDRNLYISGNYDHKGFNTKTHTGTATDYEIDNFTWGLAGNLFDSWGGGGANSANLSLVRGRVNLDGSPNQADDRNGANTQGYFTKLRYSLSRQQTLTPAVTLSAALTGQVASKNLDGSEKLYLGGATGVRAYPSSEAGGSDGQMLNLELRSRLADGWEASVFYDWGRIKQYHNTRFSGVPRNNTLALSGRGASLSWRSPQGLILKATWAHRNGANPNPTAPPNSKDQDGSLKLNRFWLSASYAF